MLKAKRTLGILISYVENTDSTKPIIVSHDNPISLVRTILTFKHIPKVKFISQKGKKLITQNLTKSEIKTEVLNRIEKGGLTTKEKVTLYELFKVKLPESLKPKKVGSKNKSSKKPGAKKTTAGTKRKVRK